MRKRLSVTLAAGLAAVCVTGGPGLLANHAPVPSPPDIVFVGVEVDATGSFGPEVVTGYWHVFDVTSRGTTDWVNGHNGNTFKLWRRRDSSGGTAFLQAPVESTQANPNNKRTTFRIRSKVSPAEFEWTNSFYVTEHGGLSQADSTGPSATIAVTTPMPPVVLDTSFGAANAAALVNEAGALRNVSQLETLLAEATLPTIRMVIFGFNLAIPEYSWSETGPVPGTYPRPRIRWNGEFGLVSAERKSTFSNGVEFNVPLDLLRDFDGTGTAQIEVVQGTAQVASTPYVLTLAPPPPGARNVVAVAETKKPRVTVRWEPAPVPVGQYVIERGVVSAPAAKVAPRAAGPVEFAEIARVGGDVRAFLDKSAQENVTYAYRVATVVGGTVSNRSRQDDAYTVGKFTLPQLDLWSGSYDVTLREKGVVGGPAPREVKGILGIDRVDGKMKYSLRPQTFGDDAFITGFLPESAIRRLNWVGGLSVTDPGDPAGWGDWPVGAGLASLSLRKRVKDAVGLVEFIGEIKSRAGPLQVSYDRREQFANWQVSLAATVGAGKHEAAPGDVVVVVFECASLGPRPLIAGRAGVSLEIDDGVVESASLGTERGAWGTMFRPFGVDDVAGLDLVVFDLGAIDADKKGRSLTEKLVLFVRVTGAPGEQMRCRFRLQDMQANNFPGVEPSQLVPLTFPLPERVVEVAIVPPK